MNNDRAGCGLLGLKWVLGLVILVQAATFAFSPASAHAFARTGLPNFIRLALAWAEMAAAVVFLIPRATIAGGWLLLVVLASAVVLHLLHGWLDVGGLLIYAAATWAVMSGKPQTARA
jgi:thiosulfate reductase cytochrome b subunit